MEKRKKNEWTYCTQNRNACTRFPTPRFPEKLVFQCLPERQKQFFLISVHTTYKFAQNEANGFPPWCRCDWTKRKKILTFYANVPIFIFLLATYLVMFLSSFLYAIHIHILLEDFFVVFVINKCYSLSSFCQKKIIGRNSERRDWDVNLNLLAQERLRAGLYRFKFPPSHELDEKATATHKHTLTPPTSPKSLERLQHSGLCSLTDENVEKKKKTYKPQIQLQTTGAEDA